MKALIDANVLMDALSRREPFYTNGKRVVELCGRDDVEGIIAAHSITNLFYLLRKDFTGDEIREILLNLCDIFFIEGVGADKLISALSSKNFRDFEDCLQTECAIATNAEYIVTRNKKDFAGSSIPCIAPEEFCRMMMGPFEI